MWPFPLSRHIQTWLWSILMLSAVLLCACSQAPRSLPHLHGLERTQLHERLGEPHSSMVLKANDYDNYEFRSGLSGLFDKLPPGAEIHELTWKTSSGTTLVWLCPNATTHTSCDSLAWPTATQL